MASKSKPVPRTQRNIQRDVPSNRGYELRRDNDTTKNVQVSLIDHDSAIMFYFNEVIKPTVVEGDEQIKVPVLYSNPERWKSINKDGYIRDSKRSIITPLVVFRRTSIQKDDTIAVDKFDPTKPKLFYTFEQKYSQKNRYDRFSQQIGLLQQKEYYNVAVPDYMTMNYEAIIWTSYVAQMNQLVEKINFSDGAYWGEEGKFKFRANIDSFEDSTEFGDNERIIKTTFNFSFRGYLIPESFNEFMNTQKYFTPSRIDIEDNTGLQFTPNFGIGGNKLEVLHTQAKGSGIPNQLGGATDFMRGATRSGGGEAQDIQFTNTFGGETLYTMRNGGEPTSSADTTAVLQFGFAESNYELKSFVISGSSSSSLYNIPDQSQQTASVYSLTSSIDTGFQLRNGSLNISINGVDLSSEQNQLQSGSVDFFISSSQQEFLVRKPTVEDPFHGHNIDQTEFLTIRFQQEKVF